ncbi:MAG: M16 family metallopeptidase, partial [Candidatus Zipacnadales bacterium]
ERVDAAPLATHATGGLETVRLRSPHYTFAAWRSDASLAYSVTGVLLGVSLIWATSYSAAAVSVFPLQITPVVRLADWPSARQTLGNGLEVLCAENPTTHTVAIVAFIKTSARAETSATVGLRNFVAQAVVECSATDQPAIVEQVQRLGLEIFSGASLDASQITVRAAVEDTEPAIKLLRQILFEPVFKEESIRRLRARAQIMLKRAEETPEIIADRACAARLYPNHPFGWPVEGFERTLADFTVERVRQAHQSAYVPNNVLIVITGGISPKTALDLASREFGGLLPGAPPLETTQEAGPPKEGLEQLSCPTVSAYVQIGTRAPGLADPSYPAAAVALAILGSGMGSWLYDVLRREEGTAYSFVAEPRTAREGARAVVIAACAPEHVPKAEGRILLAIRRLSMEAVSAEEIQRAKEYICTGHAIAHQRSVDFAHQLGALELASGRGVELDRKLPELIREVTAEQIRSVARQMFETRVRVRVMPA